MRKVTSTLFVISLLLTTLATADANAGWSPYGMPICSYAGDQRYCTAASDGEGGAIIVWSDYRNSYAYVYCQRINAAGDVLWTTNGISIRDMEGTPSSPVLVSDGSGGAIIAWQDIRHGSYWQIYAQRVNAQGTIMWTAGGVRVTDSLADESGPDITTDGAGGAIITWTGNWAPSGTEDDIYASRIDASGTIVWGGISGSVVTTATGDQNYPGLVSDGSGGAVIVWTDHRSGTDYDIYAQKVDSSGNMLWTANGAAVCTASGDQRYPVLTYDGAGAAIFAWSDTRNGTSEIYAARLNQFGGTQTWWYTDGVPVIQAAGYENYPVIVSDGAGGTIIGWLDSRNLYDLYVQRMDSRANKLWASSGVRVTPDSDVATPFHIVTDGANGAIAAWRDTGSSDVFTAQRIDRTGALRWGADGLAITEGMAGHDAGSLVSANAGGAIMAFSGEHLSYDLYAQRIDHYGEWGIPNPSLVSAEDVPADQGGNVLLTWQASYLDRDPYQKITHYSIWRKLNPVMAAELVSRGIEGTDPSMIDSDFSGTAYIFSIDQAAAAGYEWIRNQDAVYLHEYSFTAPTLHDSISGLPGMHEFVVRAHTADAYVSWASDPLEGYSVDNLAPAAPVGVIALQQNEPDRLALSWQDNTEDDILGYNIYRGTESSFEPGPANLIASTAENSYEDMGWLPENIYYYRLAAVDVHENIGPAVLLGPGQVILATELQSFATSYEDDSIIISWTLSEAGENMQFTALRAVAPGDDFKAIEGVEIEGEGMEYRFSDHTAARGATYIYRVIVDDEDGTRTLFETPAAGLPRSSVALFPNYPNPFNPVTSIRFYLPDPCWTRLEIYDSAGRKVRGLIDEMRLRGDHTLTWNGEDDQGNRVSSGVYFYRVRAGKVTITSKMVLLR